MMFLEYTDSICTFRYTEIGTQTGLYNVTQAQKKKK